MIIIEGLNILLLAVTVLFIGYYVLLGVLAFTSKRKIDYSTENVRKYAIVLLAENEGNTFSRSLYSLSGLVYPKNKYDLFVIANNLSDQVIREAESLGAITLMLSEEENAANKDIILARAFDHIMQRTKQYDALIVFSSDCLVSGNYLKVMNHYLEQGSEVVQSCHQVLPQTRNWVQKVLKIEFLINNKIKFLGRRFLGSSMRLRDTGICFAVPLLREIRWDINEQKNIIEYGLELQLKGIEIDFAPEAIFFSEIVDQQNIPSYKKTLLERYNIIRKYGPRFLKLFIQTKSFQYLDRYIDLILPKFSTAINLIMGAILFNGIGWSIGLIPMIYTIMWLEIMIAGWLSVFMLLLVLEEKDKLVKSTVYLPIIFFINISPFWRWLWLFENKKDIKMDKVDRDREPLIFSDDNHSM